MSQYSDVDLEGPERTDHGGSSGGFVTSVPSYQVYNQILLSSYACKFLEGDFIGLVTSLAG